MGKYYELNAQGNFLRKPRPAPEATTDAESSFNHLDDPEFVASYSRPREGGEREMTFFLENVHCVACVWLTEKVPAFVNGVSSVRLNLGTSIAHVRIKPNGSFAAAAREFLRFGYRPHPVRQGEAIDRQKRESRRSLLRLGIAGACTGNIMLLAVSVYGGLGGAMAQYFGWVSFALYLPVLFYSAAPMFRGAWSTLKAKQLSIDFTIVFAIVIGSAISFHQLLIGSPHVYFDSLAALVFLLLSSRHMLLKAQQAAANASEIIHYLTPNVVRRRTESGGFESVRIERVQPGDVLEVRAGESIPVDGKIVEGESALNCALLTGESRIEAVGPGDMVFAGTVNQQAPLFVQVLRSGSETRLGKILRAVDENLSRKASIIDFGDRIAKYFVAGVIAASVLVFLVAARDSLQIGIERMLALAIVTCPCAFALATPLALALSLGRSARTGILIKGSIALEKLNGISEVFLDKTGTLTTGTFEVLSWENGGGANVELAAAALESQSNHPIAKALVRHFGWRADELPKVEEFKETIGKGVSGRVNGALYEVRQDQQDEGEGESRSIGSKVAVYRDGKRVGRAVLGDQLRADSAEAVRALQAMGLPVWILTGDSREAALDVARQLGIPSERVIAEASPESKNEVIRQHPGALMVGDGANDALALTSARVGVAVHSGMEISMRAADVYHYEAGVLPLRRLLVISRETFKVIHRNLWISVLYNVVGGTAAVMGYVSPLFAAVFMPASAFTVFILSVIGTGKLRRQFKEGAL